MVGDVLLCPLLTEQRYQGVEYRALKLHKHSQSGAKICNPTGLQLGTELTHFEKSFRHANRRI